MKPRLTCQLSEVCPVTFFLWKESYRWSVPEHLLTNDGLGDRRKMYEMIPNFRTFTALSGSRTVT